MSVSKTLSFVGCVFFALGMLCLLPGMPHKFSLFRFAGWFVTSGWLLQQWETSDRCLGMRRKLGPILEVADEYFLPSLMVIVMMVMLVFVALCRMIAR